MTGSSVASRLRPQCLLSLASFLLLAAPLKIGYSEAGPEVHMSSSAILDLVPVIPLCGNGLVLAYE